MIVKQILFLLACVTLLTGCSSGSSPEIHAICLRDDIGNYIIKWETDPVVDGTLKLYVSDTPETFDMANPVGFAKINDGVYRYITNDNVTRKYFLLSFNDKYFQSVGARLVPMDSIRNVRDLGGYGVKHCNLTTRWGKIFRSSELRNLSKTDSLRFKNLSIKTIIDLRGEDEVALYPESSIQAKIISIPIPITGRDDLHRRVQEGRMRKGDGLLFMQDTYLKYISEDSEQFAQALNVFLDEKNYPILVNCSLGKDRVGFLTAMLLSALDVPEETIMNDYMLSNENIDIKRIAYMARDLSQDAQETISVLISANETFMDVVFKQIRKEYGSTDKYLTKGLHLSEKERHKLKDILLYQSVSE